MSKVAFFYATGTAYLVNLLQVGFSIDLGLNQPAANTATVAGLNGKTALWNGGPQADPFPALLDPDVWTATKVPYPAVQFPMGPSIDDGITRMKAAIDALPVGAPFAIGGFSQGAAVASGIKLLIESGTMTSRQNGYLGGVVFGNPRRQLNYRGAVGGTWSGAWDVPGSTTGGHGSFPSTGSYARLTGCDPADWLEFAYPDDVFTSVGDSTLGQNWTAGNGVFLSLGSGGLITYLAGGGTLAIIDAAQQAMTLGGQALTFTDGAGTVFNWLGGNGHTAPPFAAPSGTSGKTGYQLGLEWLNSLATQFAVAPIIIAPTTAGWSTTLVPPAA